MRRMREVSLGKIQMTLDRRLTSLFNRSSGWFLRRWAPGERSERQQVRPDSAHRLGSLGNIASSMSGEFVLSSHRLSDGADRPERAATILGFPLGTVASSFRV